MQQPKQKELNAAFTQFAKALGKQVGDKPGEWHLEFTGGGWRVRTCDSTSAFHYPMGKNCFSPREFLIALFFSTQTLTVYQESTMSFMSGKTS